MNGTMPEVSGSLEIWLSRPDDASEWQLLNARMRFTRHSSRMTMDSPVDISNALHPTVAKAVLDRLDGITETAVFSDSEYMGQIPGLALHGLRILTHANTNGSASASVRFVQTLGDMTAVFQPPYHQQTQANDCLDWMTLPVLYELLMPAMEALDHVLDHGLQDDHARALAARVKTMRARRDELSDYISLLTRYIESTQNAKPPAALDSVDHARPKDTPVSRDDTPARPVVQLLQTDDARAPVRVPAPLAPVPTAGNLHAIGCNGRPLDWSPSAGIVRGDGMGILYGHQAKTDTVS